MNKLICVVPTQLFGLSSDIDICRQILGLEVLIVEDAAQSFGYGCNKKNGTNVDLHFSSLGREKVLSTIEGGIPSNIALIFLSYITKKMQESSMFRNHTLQDILDELDAIERFEIPGKKLQVGEMTKRHSEL